MCPISPKQVKAEAIKKKKKKNIRESYRNQYQRAWWDVSQEMEKH